MQKSKKILSLLLAIITLFSASIVTATPVSAARYPSSNSFFYCNSSVSIGRGEVAYVPVVLTSNGLARIRKWNSDKFCCLSESEYGRVKTQRKIWMSKKDLLSKKKFEVPICGNIVCSDRLGFYISSGDSVHERELVVYQSVTVKKAPSYISLNKSSLTLGVGEQFDLDSYVNPGAAAYYRPYASLRSGIAYVTKAGGVITARSVGTTRVSVRTYNDRIASCKVTVKKAPSRVYLNKTSLTLKVGQTFDLNSSVNSGAASYHVNYYSNKAAVASVRKAGGLVTAKSRGTAIITARTYNGKTVTCKVTVK